MRAQVGDCVCFDVRRSDLMFSSTLVRPSLLCCQTLVAQSVVPEVLAIKLCKFQYTVFSPSDCISCSKTQYTVFSPSADCISCSKTQYTVFAPSAGCGRTGTMLAIDIARDMLLSKVSQL